MDIVEVNVPIGEYGKTCGMCGNFNNKEEDDWIMGPACPAYEGKLVMPINIFFFQWAEIDGPSS